MKRFESPAEATVRRQGNYAGAVSRLLAFAADVGLAWGSYTLASAGIVLAIELATGHHVDPAKYQVAGVVVAALWVFGYFVLQWAANGRTAGMALFGIKVVRADGGPIANSQALTRTLVLPISIAFLGLGFLGILVSPQRRAWHDRAAGTAVVYAWDARAAHLRWLAKQPHAAQPAGPTNERR